MSNQKNVETLLQQKKDKYHALAEETLKYAKSKGASAAEFGVSFANGFSVNVRKGEVDTLEYNRDQGMGVTVYFGQRKGSASTSDTDIDSIHSTVDAACNIARFTAEDDCAGLAEKELLTKNIPDLDLFHYWDIEPPQAIELAKQCEQIGLDSHNKITQSEGASLDTHYGLHLYANSHGFVGSYNTTNHSISCTLIAKHLSEMQRDYYYSVARDAGDLLSITEIAKKAAQRTVARLNPQQLTTRKVPVLFAPEVARGLIGQFISAISGGQLYRKSSFLLDSLGKAVFPDFIQISEQPHVPKGLGSAPYDNEGVATRPRVIVREGIVQGYILSSYSARKLGMQTTGNAGGIHNVKLHPSDENFEALLSKMDTGLLVTELMGQGVNIVTGDYSRGAAGFWVEKGKIQYPVAEITIAGNLAEMFKGIVSVGNDIDARGSIHTGSILINKMMVAGS